MGESKKGAGSMPHPVSGFNPGAEIPSFLKCHVVLCTVVQGDTSGCGEHPVEIIIKVPFWPGQARLGQNGTLVLMSMGCLPQPDVSPCRYCQCQICLGHEKSIKHNITSPSLHYDSSIRII